MMKILLLISNLVFLGINLFAQNFEWAESYGDITMDVGNSIETDNNGSVYVGGTFSGTVDFDPGPGVYNLSSASGSAFISKLDELGNLIWAIQIESSSFSEGFDIAVDIAGNVYLVGLFSGIADFDPGTGTYNLSSVGNKDIFIAKFDVDGNFIWANSVGGTADDKGFSVALDQDQNVIVGGTFQLTPDFDPGPGVFNLTSFGSGDNFILKLDADGNFIWAVQLGGASNESIYSIDADTSGNILSTGYFFGTSDFDPGASVYNLSSNGNMDIFLSKLDADGNFVWAFNLGSGNADEGQAITTDIAGNIYETGYFVGTVDFDPGAGTANSTCIGFMDVFISKYDKDGNYIWSKTFEGTGSDEAFDIHIDDWGNVFTTGYFGSVVDFDPGSGTENLTAFGNSDAFVSKLDSMGNFVWAKQFGGVDFDQGFSISVATNGSIYTTGNFQSTCDFDPDAGVYNLNSNGSGDIFVHKMWECVPTNSMISPVVCNEYTSPSGLYNWTVSGLYSDTLVNVGGCDSIITIDLQVNTVDTSVSQSGTLLTANATGASYQWLNCNAGYLQISGESSQAFNATSNGTYAVEITQNGCTDTSSCYTVTGLGVAEIYSSLEIKVYPSPNTGEFYIQSKDAIGEWVEIIDFTGKSIYKCKIVSPLTLIDLSEFASGIYFASLAINGESFVYKVVKL